MDWLAFLAILKCMQQGGHRLDVPPPLNEGLVLFQVHFVAEYIVVQMNIDQMFIIITTL